MNPTFKWSLGLNLKKREHESHINNDGGITGLKQWYYYLQDKEVREKNSV